MSITFNCYYCENILNAPGPHYERATRKTGQEPLSTDFPLRCPHCHARYVFQIIIETPTHLRADQIERIGNFPRDQKGNRTQ